MSSEHAAMLLVYLTRKAELAREFGQHERAAEIEAERKALLHRASLRIPIVARPPK